MMETSNLLGQSQTFCSYGVSNMNVLWLSITNQGLCVSEVQNVQAYVLEVGWGSLGKMDRDEKRAFHRDGMNWMWVGWYWKKVRSIRRTTSVCLALICYDLCLWSLYFVCVLCVCVFTVHLGWVEVLDTSWAKLQSGWQKSTDLDQVTPSTASYLIHPFSYCRSWKMAERFGYRHVEMCEGSCYDW